VTLTERIAVLQRVADALAAVRAALLPLPDADRRAVLADVLTELERPAVNEPPPVVQPPPPGKPLPRPKREPTYSQPPDNAGERRENLLRLLAANPDGLTSTEIEGKVGYDGVGYYLRHPWFEKSDPAYRLSPWVLSEIGEQAAAGERAAGDLPRATAPAT